MGGLDGDANSSIGWSVGDAGADGGHEGGGDVSVKRRIAWGRVRIHCYIYDSPNYGSMQAVRVIVD